MKLCLQCDAIEHGTMNHIYNVMPLNVKDAKSFVAKKKSEKICKP